MPEPTVTHHGLNTRVAVEEGAALAAQSIELARDEGVEVLQEVGDAPGAVVGDEVVVGGDKLELVELHAGLFAVAAGDDAEAEVDDAPNDGLGDETKALVDAAAGREDGGIRIEVARSGHRSGEVGRQRRALHRGGVGDRQPDPEVEVAGATKGFRGGAS